MDDSNYLIDFDRIFFGVVNDKLREIAHDSDLVTQFFMSVVIGHLQKTIDHEENTVELRNIIRKKLVPICVEKLMNIIDEEISDNPKKHKLLEDIFKEHSGTFSIVADEFKKRFKNMDRSKKVGFFDAKIKNT